MNNKIELKTNFGSLYLLEGNCGWAFVLCDSRQIELHYYADTKFFSYINELINCKDENRFFEVLGEMVNSSIIVYDKDEKQLVEKVKKVYLEKYDDEITEETILVETCSIGDYHVYGEWN